MHVPAVKFVPKGETLCDVASLPEWMQPAFEGVKQLNRVQSKLMEPALMGSDNLLLCAPTGAGKTNVAMLCILNQVGW